MKAYDDRAGNENRSSTNAKCRLIKKGRIEIDWKERIRQPQEL